MSIEMTPRRVALIRNSWSRVVPISAQVGVLFYERLFDIAPETQSYFGEDIELQGQKLMQMLGSLVGSLNDFEQIIPAIQDLGRRHKDYGVQPEQYLPVGEALIWALEQGLGDEFTPEMRAAWLDVYELMTLIMLDVANS